jgi:hypothetical protein
LAAIFEVPHDASHEGILPKKQHSEDVNLLEAFSVIGNF